MTNISILALVAIACAPFYTSAFAPSTYSIQKPAVSSPLFNIQTKLCAPNQNSIFNHDRNQSTTRMNMMAPGASGAAAMMGVVTGGVLGGALHAIAGKCRLALRIFCVKTQHRDVDEEVLIFQLRRSERSLINRH